MNKRSYLGVGTQNNFNGNISRIDWSGSTGGGKIRTYNYLYDPANRILTANYTAASETNWFTVSGMTYDANGNLGKLIRNNQRTSTTYGEVDNLTYTYEPSSNRLFQVADSDLALAYTSKDFKERSNTAFTYDANGNQKTNLDKQISNIDYNHLNLPREVSFNTGAKIIFSYDAEGTKLTQKVYSTGGALTKTQDYVGETVFLDAGLDYFIHEEGRVAYELGTYQYEYFIKDHLGNVRQVLRNPSTQVYMATMETQNAETEEQEFTQVEVSRHLSPEHNKTVGGNQVAWLNANRGRMVGPGRTQEIFAGDSIGLQVFGKYLDKKKPKVNAGSFVSQGAKDRLVANLNELALNTQRAGGGNPIALLNLASIVAGDLQKKPAPEAYLIYALYDQDSNRYEVGKKVLTRNAANQHEVLEENLYIQKDGYLETFVVNETSEDVWFDNMMVMSMSSPIAQETHYDPWGLELTGIGFQYGGIKVNKFLYNGKELIEDNGLQYYDYGARMYDPAIGRWGVVDPMADHILQIDKSPYAYGWNNPIKYIDPNGMCPNGCSENEKRGDIYAEGAVVQNRFGASQIKDGKWIKISSSPMTENSSDGIRMNGFFGGGSSGNLYNGNSLEAGIGVDVSLSMLSTASYATGVYEDARATQISKYTREYLKEYKAIRSFNKGYKTARQATLASNILKNVNMMEGMKVGARRMAGVGLVLGVADMANNDFSGESVGWFAADTIMTGVGFTGWGAPVSGVYFLGRFAFGIYDMASKEEN